MNIDKLVLDEYKRQQETLQLIAAENVTKKDVLQPLSSLISCKTAEGEVGNRYHMGCEVVDKIESIAEERLKKLFNSKKVWVQPHSGSTANQIVIFSLLNKYIPKTKEARILSMGLDCGGHLTHGSKYNIIGKLFNIRHYCVNRDTYLLDYDVIRRMAEEFKPHLIICGASSYPRTIDFKKFGEIAQDNDAYLLSDIAHIFGLIVGKVHQSPVKHSTFVTSSTYKAGGPRGGVIISGDKSEKALREKMTLSVFPSMQSTPDFSNIASKAKFFKECATKEYMQTQKQIIRNAKILASELMKYGYSIVTNGTDTHMVLVNIKESRKLTGRQAEHILMSCGINVNRNVIPYDTENPMTTSGIRFGTNTITRIGMKEKEVKRIAYLIDDAFNGHIENKKLEVKELMSEFSVLI